MGRAFRPNYLNNGRPIQFDYLGKEYPELLIAVRDYKCGYISDARFLLCKAYLLYYIAAPCYTRIEHLEPLKLEAQLLSDSTEIQSWVLHAGRFAIFPFVSKAEFQKLMIDGNLGIL